MHLRVVSERFKVSDALDRAGDGFLVDDTALTEVDRKAESFFDDALEDLELYLAHELHLYLAVPLVPHDLELRIFGFQNPKL